MNWIARIRHERGTAWRMGRQVWLRVNSLHLPITFIKPAVRSVYVLHNLVTAAIAKLKRFFYSEPLFRSKCRKVGSYFQMDALPYIAGHGVIDIADQVRLSGKSNIVFSNQRRLDPHLQIGDRVFIGHGCMLNIADSLVIEHDVLIAGGVLIYDFDGHPYDAASRQKDATIGADNVKAVRIGAHAWIGARALILKGVTIGEGAIVAAGSVVSRNVAPHTVVAGNPAREVKRLSTVTDTPTHPVATPHPVALTS